MYKYSLLNSVALSCVILFSVATVKAADSVATVNGKAISQESYDNYVKTLPMSPTMSPDRQAVVNELVNRELVVQDALSKNLDKDSAFLKRLEQIRYNILFEAGVQNYLKTHPITEERLRQEYSKFKPLKQYKARHILTKTKEDAVAIIGELQQGANFAQLAMQKSIDPMSRLQGGDLDWLATGQMLKPVADAVVTLQKGQVAPQPIQSHVGWHVLLLEDIRELPPLPFESAKEGLRASTQTQLVAEYIEELRKQGKVEISN